MTTPATTEERHASWLELFFDLVIVAAVAQLAHLLHDAPRPFDVFLFAVLYYAIWSVWTAFTLYANVAGDRTRRRAMLAAMFGIAVMAASIPKVAEGNPGSFVGAYIVCRVLAAGSWKRSSRVMTEWPAVQQAIGLIPWIVSVGFGPPMRYVLWTAGVGLDVLLSVWRSREPRRVLELEQRQRERERRTWMRRIARNARWQRRMPELPDVQPAEPNRPYLGERLGLFVIIVLGEAVAQVVNAAGAVTVWHRDLWLVVLAGFGLLVCLWWLTLQYGPTAAPG